LIRLPIVLSTGLGIGYTPFAPGTMASFVALPIGYAVLFFHGTLALLLMGIGILAVGIWASGAHARIVGRYDPGTSVIDEIAGQFLAMLPIAPAGNLADGTRIAAAFVLFRFFDIVKPWPISRLERLHGGVGIMADDCAAGLVSAVLLYCMLSWGWI
jgi:phosphatidylglycerophosphatase A